jgi:hypothetical protein
MEDENGQGGSVVTEYSSYEDFLDSQITATDLYYLEDEELGMNFTYDALNHIKISREGIEKNVKYRRVYLNGQVLRVDLG